MISYASDVRIKGNQLILDITPKSLSYCNEEVYSKLLSVKHPHTEELSDSLLLNIVVDQNMFSPFFLMANQVEEIVSMRSLLSIFESEEGYYSNMLKTNYLALGMPAMVEEYGFNR